jgi:hypothetical protein
MLASGARSPHKASIGSLRDKADAPTMILHGCCDDMVALWNSPEVTRLLGSKRVSLVNSPGLYV